MMNRKTPLFLAGLLGTALMASATAYAEDAPAAAPAAAAAAAEPASPHTFSANVGLFSQYVFRGITYTNEQAALQGGFDYAHSSGFYAGVWGSSVDQDGLYGNTLEIDLYGGYANTIGNTGIGYNVGVLQFYYPNNESIGDYNSNNAVLGDESPNTTELNAALSWKWFQLKYSYAVSNFFGLDSKSMGDGKGDSDGSDYLELNFNYVLPYDVNLALHVGRQTVEGRDQMDYTDFLIGVNKNFAVGSSTGWNAGVNYTTTNADDNWWVDGKLQETGDDHVIVYLKRTF